VRIGLVVHPTRDVQGPLAALRHCAGEQDVEFVQVPVHGQQQEVAPFGEIETCAVVMAIGGDGTALAAVRVAAPQGLPVLAVACGSLGVLTGVDAQEIRSAVERFERGDWHPRSLPALELECADGERFTAYNDMAIVRRGAGQVRVLARVDGNLYARLAGDGCIVSTPVGSSAYALAAGGPLLVPGCGSYVLTPLSSHGGSIPPLVLGGGDRLQIELRASRGGGRLEIDGQLAAEEARSMDIRLRPEAATLVTFEGEEPFLAGLRRRGLIGDSPRILADDARSS